MDEKLPHQPRICTRRGHPRLHSIGLKWEARNFKHKAGRFFSGIYLTFLAHSLINGNKGAKSVWVNFDKGI